MKILLLLFAFAIAGDVAVAQVVPSPPFSLGQPARWRLAGGVMGGYGWDRQSSMARGFMNFTPEGLAPNLGIDFISVEGAANVENGNWGAEVGNYLRLPYLRFGLEYDFRDRAVEWVTSVQYGVRRGGLFHHAEELRLDYRGRNKELLIGIVFNTTFSRYRATRPYSKTTKIPRGDVPDPPKPIEKNGLRPDLEESLRQVEHSVEWMDRLLTPRFFHDNIEKRANAYRDHIRMRGHTFLEEDERYHTELRRAFELAIADKTVADQLAMEAERIIYEQIVVPYNGYFGVSKDPWQPSGYVQNAVAAFSELLDGHGRFNLMTSEAADGPRDLAGEVFRRTVAAIDKAADAAHDRWKTAKAFWAQQARLVWLPLQYGLQPHQYDTQEEWDLITEQLTMQKFTRTNNMEYMLNERFHPELLRMIHDTEQYHVLLIHDFTGWNKDKSPDEWGWEMVAKGYMQAMINAVKAMDAGEREYFPQYMLFIDQNFYQGNRSRNIVTYMDNIFEMEEADIGDGSVKTLVDNTHNELIKTVRASKVFGGKSDDELKKLFKVHVSVTNRWDPTFAFDIDKRDHRKLTFRDVFEDDPGRGEGILTGTGVGHHYQPPGWEDRAFGLKGPALVPLKRTVEKLCYSQGYRDREIPKYLRPLPFPDDYEARCQKLWDDGWRSSIMIVMNDTGYGIKKATVQRAVMYNLAPRASVLLSVDSLWLSDFWAEMYISAGLRGAHVYAIAPSPANAPSSANFTMYLMQQSMALLIAARDFFEEDLAKTDGQIYVGLYNHDYGVDDIVARSSAFLQNTDLRPFILKDFPMHEDVFDVYREYIEKWKGMAEINDVGATNTKDVVKPYLHMKTQFFGTEVALDILRQEEWVPIVRRFAEIRTKQLLGEETRGMTPLALVENRDSTSNQAVLIDDYLEYVEENRAPDQWNSAIMAFTIGSMNQDRRGMLSDGEVLAVCSSYTALIGVLDMFGAAVTAAYPADLDELDQLFPEPSVSTRTKRIARYLQDFF